MSQLARLHKSTVVLIHVADGWAARNQQGLALRESAEMRDDRDYIEARRNDLEAAGIQAECVLAGGDPGTEIATAADREVGGAGKLKLERRRERIEDVEMCHGRVLLRGSVANEVRHRTTVPVLMVRGAPRRVKPA